MANVPHSGLTGADLHESKGTAAAAANTAFIADGAGSGTYQKVPLAALSPGSNPFGQQLFHVREQAAAGTASASAGTTNSWITTALNTSMTNEIAGASLSSNQITLPAGTYFIDAVVPYAVSSGTSSHYLRTRLFDFTSSAVLLVGNPIYLYGASTGGGLSRLVGRFTLAGTKVLILQHFKDLGFAGQPLNTASTVEVYAGALIWKTA